MIFLNEFWTFKKFLPKYQKCFEPNSGEPKFMIFSFPALILTMSWSILGSSSDWLRDINRANVKMIL